MNTTAKRRTATAAIAATAIALVPFAASANVLDDPIRFDTGHIDAFNVTLNDDDSIRLTLKEDVTGSHVQREPESVELFVKDSAYTENLPASFIPPGAPDAMWYLPLTQDHNLIWPGWDSMEIAPVYGVNATVDIEILEVDGPGDIYLWSNGSFGELRQLLTDGYQLPGTIRQTFTAHVHANWGFTEPGTYQLQVQATAANAAGTLTSTSDVHTYTFIVAEESDAEPGEVAVSIAGASGHFHTGDVVTLTAVQTPEVSDHYHWFTRATADDEWEVVPGALTGVYGFVATQEHQVKVAVYDDDHVLLAESEPVLIDIDDHGNTPGIGPEIETELSPNEGALVISVAPDARQARLSDLELNAAADRYVSEGAITGITVTDTRSGSLGWAANGRVRGLASVDGDRIDGSFVGWTPVVNSTSGATVNPGDAVDPGFDNGTGIRGWSTLGTSPAGSSVGTAVLGADIRVEAPVTTPAGTYAGVVLITVI